MIREPLVLQSAQSNRGMTVLVARIRRYSKRVKEAGVAATARIAFSRASGYALFIPSAVTRLFLVLRPPPRFDGRTNRRVGGQQIRFLLLWGAEELKRLEVELASNSPGGAPGSMAIQRANAFLRGELSLLGWGKIGTSIPPPWHSDLYRRVDWPLKFHKRIDCVRSGSHCDVKVPWELSRMQFLPWLGQAWLVSRNPEYLSHLWEVLRDWIIGNPRGYGINWTCSMEVSIRALNIAAAANLVGEALTPSEEHWVGRILLDHYKHITFNLELSDVNGNHYFFDLLGLAVLSILLFGTNSRRTYRHVRRLVDEAAAQFHSDGVHIENSTGYHRLVTDGLVFFLIVCRRNFIALPEKYEETVRRALLFLDSIAASDGSIPLIGDSDGGNLLILGNGRGNEARSVLQGGEITLGTPVRRETDPRLWGTATYPFPEGGYFIVRNAETLLAIRCGTSGLRGRGSHDHNDQLSFCLSLFGLPLILDPGTSNYTSQENDHVGDLSTLRHNTVTINNKEQAPIQMGSVTHTVRSVEATCDRFGSANGQIEFRGKINSYYRKGSGLRHERWIEILNFTTDRLNLRITDTVRAAKSEDIDCMATFMLHPNWKIVEASSDLGEVNLHSDHAIASMAFQGNSEPPIVAAESYSPEYGSKVPCSALRVPFSGARNAVLVTNLASTRRSRGRE